MASHKIYMGGDEYCGGGGAAPSAQISKQPGNTLKQETDGLYVPAGSVNISKEDGNIIETKTDGLYVKIDETNPFTKQAIQDIIVSMLEIENIDFSDF